jgi:RNA polymerase sigma-70 factor (ECF subfamily)
MESLAEREGPLIREALGGSEEAFSGLVRLHQAAVQAYLGRTIRNLDVVEDLAQETFLKAYRNLPQFRAASPFRVWLFGIARTEALMHWRQERARRAQEGRSLGRALQDWLGARVEAEASGPEAHERKVTALETCVKGLPDRSAALIEEYYVKGHTIGQIARATGKSEVAVRVTLLRIRQALRDCIQGKIAVAGTGA